MKKVSISERCGKPVAELRPATRKPKKVKMPDMSRFWNTFPQVRGDSTQFISEDRDRLMKPPVD